MVPVVSLLQRLVPLYRTANCGPSAVNVLILQRLPCTDEMTCCKLVTVAIVTISLFVLMFQKLQHMRQESSREVSNLKQVISDLERKLATHTKGRRRP